MSDIQVSIIIVLYNSNMIKAERTIKSAVSQKNIDFEIIVSDDGSKDDPTDNIISIFKKYNFTNYKININPQNLGTVKNILSALKLSRGKYVYCISPGDMIYDDNTINYFFQFAEENDACVCFGNYYDYKMVDEKSQIIGRISSSARTPFYCEKKSFTMYKLLIMFGEGILGPAFFRERNYALKYIGQVSEVSKYVEDNTSVICSLVDKVPIYYYDKKICWYECDTGISRMENSEWSTRIFDDFRKTFELLIKQYPKDTILRAVYKRRYSKENDGKLFSVLVLLIRHPIACFKRSFLKQGKQCTISEKEKYLLGEELKLKLSILD